MSVTSTRTTQITFTGDVEGTQVANAQSNGVSPGQTDVRTLASGNNTITCPTGGSTPSAATIIPPDGNTVAITLKGVNGDTGIRIHNTDPTEVGLHSSVVSFVLNAASAVTGLRIIWS